MGQHQGSKFKGQKGLQDPPLHRDETCSYISKMNAEENTETQRCLQLNLSTKTLIELNEFAVSSSSLVNLIAF